MKIIVVDDEISSLSMFLAHLVNKTEIEYKFFQDHPSEALSYVKSTRVDGAFLDINMPEMNGLDLARSLVQVNPAIRIAFITGYSADVEAIEKEFGKNLLGFAYKPFDSSLINQYIQTLYFAAEKPLIEARLFGPFDLFVNQVPVRFSSSKSKELLALLCTYRGSSLTMDDAIGHLWPDKDIDLAKKLYRDAIWRLRKALKEQGIAFLVEFSRGAAALHVEVLSCDYWDYLNGHKELYLGQFLSGYDWSLEYQYQLDVRA